VLWNAEENHTTQSQRLRFNAFGYGIVTGDLRVTWHGRDLFADALAFHYEERQNQIARRERRLSDESAYGFGSAQPAWAMQRERHGSIMLRRCKYLLKPNTPRRCTGG
jgi:hypothetical protein